MGRLFGCFLAVLALAACMAADPPPAQMARAEAAPAQVERGRDLATRICVSCHATDAEGPSRNPDAPPLPRLAERYPGTLLADAFPERMKNGHPAMPDFGFTDADVDALLAYLLSIQERQGA